MYKHSKLVTYLLAAVLVMGMAFTGVARADESKSYTLRVSTPYPPPEQSLATKHLVTWEQMVTERSNGAIKFQNFYGGALGKASEHLSLCSTGTADIVVTYGWYTPSKLPLEDYDYAFPFGPTDPYILTKAMRQMYEEFPQFKADFKKQNLAKIFQSPGITEVFLSKEPIKGFDGFKGKKCKVIGRYFGRWIKALGAVPVSAPGTEVYTMMQTGVIDLALDTADLQYAYNNIEQAPHVLYPDLLTTNWIGCWINLKALNDLPLKYRNIILRSGEELELKAALEINPKWEEMIYSNWRKNSKYTYIEMSEKDRKRWADACPNTAAEWADHVTKLGYPGWEMLKRYMVITTNLGHVWIRDWSKK